MASASKAWLVIPSMAKCSREVPSPLCGAPSPSPSPTQLCLSRPFPCTVLTQAPIRGCLLTYSCIILFTLSFSQWTVSFLSSGNMRQ